MSESPEETHRKHGLLLHTALNPNCIECAQKILQNHIDQLADPVTATAQAAQWPKRPDVEESVVWHHGEAIPLSEWNMRHPEAHIGPASNEHERARFTAWANGVPLTSKKGIENFAVEFPMTEHNTLALALADGQRGITLRRNIEFALRRAEEDSQLSREERDDIVLSRLMSALKAALQ